MSLEYDVQQQQRIPQHLDATTNAPVVPAQLYTDLLAQQRAAHAQLDVYQQRLAAWEVWKRQAEAITRDLAKRLKEEQRIRRKLDALLAHEADARRASSSPPTSHPNGNNHHSNGNVNPQQQQQQQQQQHVHHHQRQLSAPSAYNTGPPPTTPLHSSADACLEPNATTSNNTHASSSSSSSSSGATTAVHDHFSISVHHL
jgi:hypothetical protein